MVSSVFVANCLIVDRVAVAVVSMAITEDAVVIEVELAIFVSVLSAGVSVID